MIYSIRELLVVEQATFIGFFVPFAISKQNEEFNQYVEVVYVVIIRETLEPYMIIHELIC